MAQPLRVYISFEEDPNLIPSTHDGWLTTICILDYRGSNVSGYHRYQHLYTTLPHIQTHIDTYTHNFK